MHSSHSSLFKPASFVAWSLCQSLTYSNFLAAGDLRSRVGPVKTCSAGSCNAFQSPYPTTWVCNSVYAYPCLLLHIPLCRKVGTRQSTWSAVAIPPTAFPLNALYSCWTEFGVCDCGWEGLWSKSWFLSQPCRVCTTAKRNGPRRLHRQR